MPGWKRPAWQLTGHEIDQLTGVNCKRKTPVPEARVRARARRGPTRIGWCGTAQPDYTAAEAQFMAAVERWKRSSGHWCPGDGEVLGVALGLGYTRPAPPDAAEFTRALARYRRRAGRKFPTCCECLSVLVSLGYRQAAPARTPAG